MVLLLLNLLFALLNMVLCAVNMGLGRLGVGTFNLMVAVGCAYAAGIQTGKWAPK